MRRKMITVYQYNRELSKQWDVEKNLGLKADEVSIDSGMMAWWKDENGMCFQESIKKRVNEFKDYNENNPLTKELIKEWHPVMNENLELEKLTSASNKKAWWVCKEGHEWQATIKSRNLLNSGCPYCNNKRVYLGNCLAAKNPKLAKEWHPTKNGELTPKNVTTGSSKKVWWMCSENHEWISTINNRNSGKKCPYCYSEKRGKSGE